MNTLKKVEENIYSIDTGLGIRYEVRITRNHVLHKPPGRFDTLAAAQEARDLLVDALGPKRSGRPVREDSSRKIARDALLDELASIFAMESGVSRATRLLHAMKFYVPGGRIAPNDILQVPVHWVRPAKTLARLLLNECRARVSKGVVAVDSSLTESAQTGA